MRVMAQPAFRNRAENPYNWLLYTQVSALGVNVRECTLRRALAGGFDIWHLHWPEWNPNRPRYLAALRRCAGFLGVLQWARWRGAKVVWTIHNLGAHDGRHPELERRFWNAFLRQVDGYISLSHAGADLVARRFARLRRVPGFVVPHGHYREPYPNHVTQAEARGRLGIAPGAAVVAFVGQIRAYKDVPALIEAFRAAAGPDAVLLVAGQPNPAGMEAPVRVAAAADPRVRLHPRRVGDDELQLYLNAADLVVLPYREVLNSGAALLALSFNRPVLVPAQGSLVEVRDQVGAGWVRTYDGALTAARLADAVRWARSDSRGPAPCLEPFSWGRIAQATVRAYHEILGVAGGDDVGRP